MISLRRAAENDGANALDQAIRRNMVSPFGGARRAKESRIAVTDGQFLPHPRFKGRVSEIDVYPIRPDAGSPLADVRSVRQPTKHASVLPPYAAAVDARFGVAGHPTGGRQALCHPVHTGAKLS